MASAITGFEQLFRTAVPVADEEYKLTIVATWDQISGEECSQAPAEPTTQQRFDIYCHCQSLDYKRKPRVKLEIRGSPRENALAKVTRSTAQSVATPVYWCLRLHCYWSWSCFCV